MRRRLVAIISLLVLASSAAISLARNRLGKSARTLLAMFINIYRNVSMRVLKPVVLASELIIRAERRMREFEM